MANIIWQEIRPKNLSPTTNASPTGNGWFRLYKLEDLIQNGKATYAFTFPFLARFIFPINEHMDHFTAFRIQGNANDEYLPTGDVIVPIQATGSITQQAAAVAPLNVRVLFVKNDPQFSMIIPGQRFVYASHVQAQDSSVVGGVFYYPQKQISSYTVLGHVVDTNPSTERTRQWDDRNSRVIAAVNQDFIVDVTSLYTGGPPPPPFGPSFNTVLELTALSSSTTGEVWRSTPYANFLTCGGVNKGGPAGAADCTAIFAVYDVLTPDVVAACCSGNDQNRFNCAPFQGAVPGIVSSASTNCNAFFNRFGAGMLKDPDTQRYIVSRSGEFDPLVANGCRSDPELGASKFCACERKQVFDPMIPVDLQNVLASSPQCTIPDCSSAEAYQRSNIAKKPCQINTQFCFATSAITNQGGTITQGIKATQDQRCQLNIASTNVAAPAPGATTLTGPGTATTGSVTQTGGTAGTPVGSTTNIQLNGNPQAGTLLPVSPTGSINIPTTTGASNGTNGANPATTQPPNNNIGGTATNNNNFFATNKTPIIIGAVIGGVLLLVLLLFLLSRKRSS
jgi:hypothetical protein